MGDEFSLEDALIILRRRIWFFVIPVVVLVPLGLIAVMLLPTKYTAEGKILVESQQIPTELVASTVTSAAQERIGIIRQRVMTRNRLLEIADKNNLFPRERGLSESDRAERMRERLDVSFITSSSRTRQDNTIAFTVAFTDQSPDKAFKVANEFISLFLSEDAHTRQTSASNTTEFFAAEAQQMRDRVTEIERDIAEFKQENSDALPEHLSMHLDMLESASRELNASRSTISTMEESLRMTEAQLAARLSGSTDDDGPARELQALKAELARLRGIYRDQHPNIVGLKDQIAAMQAQMAPSRDIQRLRRALSDAEIKLSQLERNSDDEAAMETQRAEVTRLVDDLSEQIGREASAGRGDFATLQLQGQIAIVKNRLRQARTTEKNLTTRISDLQSRITRTPEVERGLSGRTRDYDNIYREYQELIAKQQDAQLAENLEDDQRAEKFSILEPALMPEEPSSPKRGQLSVLAIMAALGIGGVAALGVEFMFATVRGRNHLKQITDDVPIAIIPYIETSKERGFKPLARKKKKNAPPVPEAA